MKPTMPDFTPEQQRAIAEVLPPTAEQVWVEILVLGRAGRRLFMAPQDQEEIYQVLAESGRLCHRVQVAIEDMEFAEYAPEDLEGDAAVSTLATLQEDARWQKNDPYLVITMDDLIMQDVYWLPEGIVARPLAELCYHDSNYEGWIPCGDNGRTGASILSTEIDGVEVLVVLARPDSAGIIQGAAVALREGATPVFGVVVHPPDVLALAKRSLEASCGQRS